MILIKFFLGALENSFRSPSGLTGWFTRSVMSKVNPISIQEGIKRLDLKETDVFVEIGAGSGVGLRSIVSNKNDNDNNNNIPSRIVCIEISQDFRRELKQTKKEILPLLKDDNDNNNDNNDIVEIYSDDCKSMPFLKDNSVDKMFAMNVVYFLDPLDEYTKEICRVLKPGGMVVFGCKFQKVPQDSNVFVNVDEDAIVGTMKQGGLAVTSAFVDLGDDDANYTELKGIKK
mmetsp:Transcript_2759/g.4006  ORF Transcript_2759/g.4006 Transcript_2759/m.4006 type:complete len:230 (-) Transcript_2759:101-790(-)